MNITVETASRAADDPWHSYTAADNIFPPEGLYDNATKNDLNPRPHTKDSTPLDHHCSIEDNELQPEYLTNIEPRHQANFAINKNRRASLYKYQKDIRKQITEILERGKENKVDTYSYYDNCENINPQAVARQLSQTKPKTLSLSSSLSSNSSSSHSSSSSHPTGSDASSRQTGSDVESEKEVYARCIQEGDNNLMLFCEPKKTVKTCYQQVGNNNVMVNLHMSMISNNCQILKNDGEVFKLDSDGELWLEIKVRRKNESAETSTETNSEANCCRLSSATTDNNLNGSCSDVSSVTDNISRCENCSKEPVEHTDDVTDDVDISHVTRRNAVIGSIQTRRGREAEEHSLNSEQNGLGLCDSCRFVMVEEKSDSLFMQLETYNGGPRLQDYHNLEDFTPVKEALRHRKVMDFLHNQANNFDFDVSVIELEYQNEPLYNLEHVHYINTPLHETEGDYSVPRQLEWIPTLPPRRHVTETAIAEDITPLLRQQSSTEDRTDTELSFTNTKSPDKPNNPQSPLLIPTFRRREPSENSDLSPLLSYTEATFPPWVGLPNLPDKPGNSPVKELPVPPMSRSKQTDKDNDTSMDSKPGVDSTKQPQWYHGKISNSAAKALLKGMPAGSFLVRDSSDDSGPHKYTLEFVDKNTVKRLKIIQIRERYSLKESDSTFETIDELIEEAIKVGIELKDSRNEWRQIKITPVNKP